MKCRTLTIAFWSALSVSAWSLGGIGMAQANAFVQGAQPAFPSSPVPMPPSPAFRSLGTIPAAPGMPGASTPVGTALPVRVGTPPDTMPPEPSLPPQGAMPGRMAPATPQPFPAPGQTPGAVPAAPYAGNGRLPASFPSGHYAPPPAGASPQMISGYAENMDGMAEPPHMSVQAAMKDGTLVRQHTIRVRSGKTYSILVSGVAPNLIVTPFNHPEMIVTNRKLATPVVHGRDLLVNTSPAFPVGVYVTGKNPHDPMISLTLIPEKTPPKNYKLVLPGFIPAIAPTTGNAHNYAGRMVHLMRDAALQKVPENYRQSHKELALPGAGGAMSWNWEFSWVGSRYRITGYRLKNTLGRAVNLMETNFYAKGVTAASIYPNHHLYPGESTQVFVITRLTTAHGSLGGVS